MRVRGFAGTAAWRILGESARAILSAVASASVAPPCLTRSSVSALTLTSAITVDPSGLSYSAAIGRFRALAIAGALSMPGLWLPSSQWLQVPLWTFAACDAEVTVIPAWRRSSARRLPNCSRAMVLALFATEWGV